MLQHTARPNLSEMGLLTPDNCVVAIITMVHGAPATTFPKYVVPESATH